MAQVLDQAMKSGNNVLIGSPLPRKARWTFVLPELKRPSVGGCDSARHLRRLKTAKTPAEVPKQGIAFRFSLHRFLHTNTALISKEI
ncbi:hypothetical protein K1719_006188 [Acacia pycnantha]|nr:hypothetical protein K1719_006188 [Acacia pycnantha]